ncbi:MAG: cysteine synthase A [Firmicutes bacterium]|nr:cysteine synthase A [Bacillota bacterium]
MQLSIASDVTALIGHTPLVRLNRFGEGGRGEILAKVESANPGGSVKDRAALYMINAAERAGALVPGGTIIEPTSGNTGVGLAMIAAARGYRIILVMPDSMSIERQKLLAAYGAELVLTPGSCGMAGAVAKARELAAEHSDWFMPLQFENPENCRAHEETTACEILADSRGRLDAFVAGIGTGGTVTGVGRMLKRQIPSVLLVGVEPKESAVISGGEPGLHGIQGIGAGFVPSVLDMSILDEVISVSSEDAYSATRALAACEGLLVGISSGAAAAAALEVARRLGEASRVVVLFPDTGERYLSVPGLW